MASSAGLEPTTACLEGKSSIRLSYEDNLTPVDWRFLAGIFIHRPDECSFNKRLQNPLDEVSDLPRYGCALIQAKGRNVGTGYGRVWFNRRAARFEF